MSSNVRQKLWIKVLGTRGPLAGFLKQRLHRYVTLVKRGSREDCYAKGLISSVGKRKVIITERESPRAACHLNGNPILWPPSILLAPSADRLLSGPSRGKKSYDVRRSTLHTGSSLVFLGLHEGGVRRLYSSRPTGEQPEPANQYPSSKKIKDLQKYKSAAEQESEATPFPRAILKKTVNRNLRDRLPDIAQIHRPSREELLAAATGFWSRLKVRFKWFSIRSVRPFNADEIGAFFSWFLLGHVIWIVLGTTTFFSLAIFAVNTVFAQEALARWVGIYLTKSSGIKVVFESAIVPKWGDGVITFTNVFVCRRPGQGTGKVSKGSPSTEAAAAAATARAEKLKESGDSILLNQYSDNQYTDENEEDTNYTQFDLSFKTVNVTLSFTKWFNSKGLLQDVEIKGVRGVIDRTSVHYKGQYVDPRSYKHEHNPGDFEIDSFKLEDLLVTVHQPHHFRPFSISIFSCDLPQLRRQWLFYDFLAANMIHGSFDESLFTIHPRQMHGHAGRQIGSGSDVNGQEVPWKKHSRLRIDGLNIDHLNRGIEGPFSWIHEGNVDIVADIMFPADTDESISKIMSDFYDRMEATVTSSRHPHSGRQSSTISDDSIHNEGEMSISTFRDTSDDDKRFLVMDLRVHLNDIRAAVPIFTKDLSYVNNALIRPIVAYMNSSKTFIPVHCRVVKRASEFDGSWTIFDSGLMDDLSAEVRLLPGNLSTVADIMQTYQAFAKDVTDDQARLRRFKKVGLWSLQLAVQAFFMGLAGNFA
jgi:distribution and morphology protein 31